MHDLVPVLSGGTSEQQYDGIKEPFEVILIIYELLVLHGAEDINAKSSVDEQEKEEETNEVGDLGNDVEQGVQYQLYVLLFLHQSNDTHYSECANNSRGCRKA